MQLSIVRKDSTPSGQEELHAESVTVTVKEGAESAATKPGEDTCDVHPVSGVCGLMRMLCINLMTNI